MTTAALQSVVELFPEGMTYTFCDVYDDSLPAALPQLAGPVSLVQHLPALFSGLQSTRAATVVFTDIAAAFGATPGSGYGQGGYGEGGYGGGLGDPPLSYLLQTHALRGVRARVRIRDLGTLTDLLTLNGTITDLQRRGPQATLTIETRDAEAVTTLLPKKRLLDVFPGVDLSDTRDQDAPVIVVFGQLRKVALSPVVGALDFGALRKPATGLLTVHTVYRDKRVVPPGEYTLVEATPGYYVLRFTRAQRNSNGGRFVIQADVSSTEFADNPARVVEFLLADPVFGLGKAVNAAAFAAAATEYTTLGYRITGGLHTRTAAGDVLTPLLLHGAVLDKNSAGEYTLTVDTATLHPPAALALGAGDGDRNNVDPEALTEVFPRLEETVKTLILLGLYDPEFAGSGAYLLRATRTDLTPTAAGVERTIENPYLADAATIDRECDYRWKALRTADRTVTATAAIEARAIGLNQVVALSVPWWFYTAKAFVVRGIAYEARRQETDLDAAWVCTLVPYSAALYTYEAQTVQQAPDATVLTDYTFTPPLPPPGFAVTATSLRTGPHDPTQEATFTLQATAPPVNVTHLVFSLFRQGQAAAALPAQQVVTPVTPGGVVSAELAGISGLAYDLEVFARNVSNAPGFQDGAPTQQLNQLAPGDTVAPPMPASVTMSVYLKTVTATWPSVNVDDLAAYVLLIVNGFGEILDTVELPAVKNANVMSYTRELAGQPYGSTITIHVAAKDYSRNLSAFRLASAVVTLTRTVTADYSDNSVTGGKTADLIASRITTGMLTVNGTVSINVTAINAMDIDFGIFAELRWMLAGVTQKFSLGAGTVTGLGDVFQILPSDASALIRLGSSGNAFQHLGLWFTGNIRSNANLFDGVTGPAALTPDRKIRIEDDNATLVGYLWASTT